MDMPQNHYRVSVKALIFNEDRTKILLTQEDTDTWELPGGGLDHGEDARDCLKREITEETGLETTWIADQPSYFFTYLTASKKVWKAHIVYEARLKDLNFTPSKECVDLRFFSIAEMVQLKLDTSVPFLIEKLESLR